MKIEQNPILLSYSGGKDATMALYKLQQQKANVVGLFCTYNAENKRVSMHGVALNLLKEQAKMLHLPIEFIAIPTEVDMALYDKIMSDFLRKQKAKGIHTIAFGDLFLEDLKQYRIQKLKEVGMQAIFPLWKINTKKLIQEFIALGFKAITVAVDESKLNQDFVGKLIDKKFIDTLPASVDVCGENGEFHSFVYDAPLFAQAINISIGKKVRKTYTTSTKTFGFWFCHLDLCQ